MQSRISSKINLFITGLLAGLFTIGQAQALPIDWNGQFGYDTNLIKNVRRTTDNCSKRARSNTYCPGNDEDNARYQSYIFKLKPTIVVNDSATIKGELSTGSVRGGIAGEDVTGRNSYFAQSPNGKSTITLNQFYAELYGDTAMIKVGKFAKNFGLGAVVNDGSDIWDRYFSVYNGFELRFDLGKFSVAPTFAKISSPAIGDGQINGSQDANETGITASYNDPTNNFEFAVYYALRSVETDNDMYDSDANSNNSSSSDVTLIDVFFSKRWEKFKIAMEVPMLSGEIGNNYGGSNQDLDTNAYILESSYDLNERWTVGLNGGMVKGEDGQDDFTGLYLHPNYKIAKLMFAYNYAAFQGKGDIFNGSVTNANFAKLYANYESEAWRWYLGLVMAMANQTAQEGDTFYNQDAGAQSSTPAASDQSDELGMELDVEFDYKWNPNVTVSGYLAYWQVGDFYAFDNSGEDLETNDVTATGLTVSLDF